MNKQRGVTIVGGLLIAAVIGIVGFGGYFVWNNQRDKKSVSKDVVQVESSQNEELPDEQMIDSTEWQEHSSVSDVPHSIIGSGVYSNQTTDENDFEIIRKSFEIKFPSNWSLESTVLYDEDNAKVAEFSPGLVHLADGQTCSDTLSTEESRSGDFPFDLISVETVTLTNGVSGNLEVTTNTPESGEGGLSSPWYPNSYCLELSSDTAFLMNFYEDSPEKTNSLLFETILSTVKLK